MTPPRPTAEARAEAWLEQFRWKPGMDHQRADAWAAHQQDVLGGWSQQVAALAELLDAHAAAHLRALADDTAAVERVAEALFSCSSTLHGLRFADAWPWVQERWRIKARAALAALGREA